MKQNGIPFSLNEDEQGVKYSIDERIRRAHWFCKNVFRPIENGTASPLKDNGEPFRMFVGDEGAKDKRLIGDKVKIDITQILNKDDMLTFSKNFLLEEDGSFSDDVVATPFMQHTTFTTPEIRLIYNEDFKNHVKKTVQKGMSVSGFNVAFALFITVLC